MTLKPQHVAVIEALLNLAGCAFHLADNTENDGKKRTVDAHDFDALSDALDKLDELPDDQPGYIMEGPARARWALRDLIGTDGAPPAPEGYKLVPLKLTPAMEKADPYGMGYGRLQAVWSRLLAAAPTAGVALPGGGQK